MNRGIRQYPAARQVARHGAPFAPLGKAARCGERGRIEAFEALESTPGFGGLDAIERDVRERRRFLGEPGAPAGGVEPRLERFDERRQVTHVVGRVGELFGRQRSPRPVSACVALGQLDAEQLAHQLRVADLRGKSEQRGCLLRVEYGRERNARHGQERLDVLARGVQQLRPRRVREQRR